MFAFFFFHDTATSAIYTLSLHDALPICGCPRALSGAIARGRRVHVHGGRGAPGALRRARARRRDRKSTRLNSSHSQISYAVFCLKKKKIMTILCLPLVMLRVEQTFLRSN